MPDDLQPDTAIRSSTASESLVNRSGIVMPPEAADDVAPSMDEMFEEEMGRKPNHDDNTAEKDREHTEPTAEELERASEFPEANPLEDDEPKEEVETPEPTKEVVEAAKAAEASEDDLVDQLLGKKTEEKPEGEPKEEKPEDDPYEAVKLRSDASTKTKETFADLKRTAKEREGKARDEATAAKVEVEDLRAKLAVASAQTAPPEMEAEIKELREFRATFAAEQDPEFQKKFNDRRESNVATIYETLKKNGLKDEVLDQVKKLPYDAQVEQISTWADKLPARDKVTVNGRLADNENVEADRSTALAEVKANATKILADKAEAPNRTREEFVAEAVATLKPILPQLPFLFSQVASETATPKELADIEVHNKEAVANQEILLGFLNDDSVKSRSILALAGVLAPRYRAQLGEAKTKIETLEKELAGIRKAGKLSRTARTAGTPDRAAPKIDLYDTSADDAMDQGWAAMGGGQ